MPPRCTAWAPPEHLMTAGSAPLAQEGEEDALLERLERLQAAPGGGADGERVQWLHDALRFLRASDDHWWCTHTNVTAGARGRHRGLQGGSLGTLRCGLCMALQR